MNKVYLIAILATLLAVALACVYEVFYVQRKKLHKKMVTLVGDHLLQLRNLKGTEGLPPLFLERIMNTKIHPTNEASAKDSIKTILDICHESKRRDFLLPMMHADELKIIFEWSKSSGEVADLATKVMPYIAKRHMMHVDELVAASQTRINEENTENAQKAMKTLKNLLDTALSTGILVDPKLIFFEPNKSIVEKWTKKDDSKTKIVAQQLLDSVEEAAITYKMGELKNK